MVGADMQNSHLPLSISVYVNDTTKHEAKDDLSSQLWCSCSREQRFWIQNWTHLFGL